MSPREGVYVVGTGASVFGQRPESSYSDLLCEAVFESMWDAGVEPDAIDGAWLAGSDAGARRRSAGALVEAAGLKELHVGRIVGGPASGGEAFRTAVLALQSGEHDLVLVAGAEKQSHRRSSRPDGGHPLLAHGISAAGVAALFARRRMEGGGLDRAHLDAVVVKNLVQGTRNEKAWLRRAPSEEQLANAPILADPLTLLDVAPMVDGAAAVILARPAVVKKTKRPPVRVKGVGYAVAGGEVLPLFDGSADFLSRRAPRAAAFQAYAQAGIVNARSQVHVAEVDDATSIGELLAYEELSLCGEDEAGEAMAGGFTAVGGATPVNPSGGSLSCGSAPGADVLRRIHEVARQVQGRAGAHQIEGARTGVVHGSSASGSEGFVAVLVRTDDPDALPGGRG